MIHRNPVHRVVMEIGFGFGLVRGFVFGMVLKGEPDGFEEKKKKKSEKQYKEKTPLYSTNRE
jgi:hypothetical protein